MLAIINQISAAGVISSGVMTRQIIAGMYPVEAVKYQILPLFVLAGARAAAALTIACLAEAA